MSRHVRFVHAADMHLGASFKGVDASDERVRDALVASTHEALGRVVDLCLEESVDFLVIAGDVYNAAEKSVRDQAVFRAQLRRLAEAGIHAYLVHGNHDPEDGWSAGLALPDSVHVFPSDGVGRVEHLRDGEVVAVLYGRSFPTRKVTEGYAARFHARPEDPLAIGVLHTNVGSRPGYDDYAPATLDELARAGMHYWALGHIHLPGRILEQPRAVYAGSPQGLQPNEDGPRGCFLVEADGRGVEERFVETASVRWARREVDASGLDDLDDVTDALADACEALRADADGRPVIARLTLTGASAVHGLLARPRVLDDVLRSAREDQLTRTPWLWLDELRDATRRTVDADACRDHDGFDGELVRIADAMAGERARTGLDALLDEVTARLVARPELELDADDVLARARDACLDLLLPEGDA